MTVARSLLIQLRRNRLALGLNALLACAYFLGVWALQHWLHIPLTKLVSDLVYLGQLPIYNGLFSQIGLFFWMAGATICLFGVVLLAGRKADRNLRWFLVVSGLITLYLGLDDAFLFHDYAFFVYLHLSEVVVYGLYLLLFAGYLVGFAKTILRTDYLLLGIALAFLGFSMVTDALEIPFFFEELFEEGAKFAGIVSWMVYFGSVVAGAVRERMQAE
jgi:hypothetical protein